MSSRPAARKPVCGTLQLHAVPTHRIPGTPERAGAVRRAALAATLSMGRSLRSLQRSRPDTFQLSATFAIKNLTELTTGPDQIDAVRQAIIDLAVRGKLVRHTPNDEPASELLNRIADEKRCLSRQRKIRRGGSAEFRAANDLCFELPAGWAKARFTDSLSNCRPDHSAVPYIRAIMRSLKHRSSILHLCRTERLFRSRRWQWLSVLSKDSNDSDFMPVILSWLGVAIWGVVPW